MPAERVERRLAAIFAGDIVGYSRLMGVDEEGTLRQLKAHRKELVDPKISEHRGRIVKTTGDGMLVEFGSVVDAVRCAVEIQRAMAERNADVPADKRIEFRVGVNVGDIIIEGDDIFGDGVNIAARLEGIAEPGGVYISDDTLRQIRGKIDVLCDDLGERELKNIAQPVRVYRVRLQAGKSQTDLSPMLPDKPSIVVLPFQNMSGDPEQEYFADGMVEDIITALSRFKSLFVIARNSSFVYKGRAVDVKQVGRELGVRYVLEGSVRKSSNRVRITAQLIDSATGAHLWADRFDGELKDVFDLQDQVTASVVGAIAPKLEQVEIERSKRKPTESLDAYDYYLRGLANSSQWSKEPTEEALRLFYRATELDPGFAAAYGMAAYCFVMRKGNRWIIDRASEVAEAARLSRLAVDLGADDAVALAAGGYTLAFVVHEVEKGSAYIDRAIALNANFATALVSSSWAKAFLGESDEAIKRATNSMRLSPLDPFSFRALGAIGLAHFIAGRYDEASSWGEKSMQLRPHYLPAICYVAAAQELAGRHSEAQKVMAHLRAVDSAMRVSDVKDWMPIRSADGVARYEDGLRRAGLPD
jgi:TolB-like protein/class 3 adenylate cyclase/tetratricopeptide (TPR) repeat protein